MLIRGQIEFNARLVFLRCVLHLFARNRSRRLLADFSHWRGGAADVPVFTVRNGLWDPAGFRLATSAASLKRESAAHDD